MNEPTPLNVAVVGHVEWVEFARVERVPRAGEIVHASERWEEPAGGGGVAAVELARLNGSATLFTALGSDELGRRAAAELERLGVTVRAAWVDEPQRRAFCFVDAAGERTITVLGQKLVPRGARHRLPWRELARADAAYFVSGDVDALAATRAAKVVVATARELATLRQARIALDALVGSGEDEGERFRAGDLDPPPALVVTTAGRLGGWAQPGGPYRAAPVRGAVEDTYGCGDCFAAALALGLARRMSPADAIAFAAERGAAALTRRGAHGVEAAPEG